MIMASRPEFSRHDPRDRVPPQADRPDPAGESTFGDLHNGFPLDSRRSRRHRRVEPRSSADALDDDSLGSTLGWLPGVDPEDDIDDVTSPARVRAYTWTRGRTTSAYRLEIETLLSTTDLYHENDDSTPGEHHAVAAVCQEPRSVAEVAALLAIPLGVARVVAGDMAGEGLLVVHETASVDGEIPGLALMERILSGLRTL
jgi:hypothetical protein